MGDRRLSLPTDYQSYIHTSRYAKWLPEEERRETFDESVTRYIDFLYEQIKGKDLLSKKDLKLLYGLLGASCDR